jgi:AIG2 family protein
VRLLERVPSANLLGVAVLDKHRLVFHKKSQDGSSKCNLVHTGGESDGVYGAIYQIDSAHKQALDRFEGNGNGYQDSQLTVELHGKEHSCFTYFAQQSYIETNLKPYHWYKNLVVLGAKHLQFPDGYVRSIDLNESVEDPDETRRTQHELLIEKVVHFR